MCVGSWVGGVVVCCLLCGCGVGGYVCWMVCVCGCVYERFVRIVVVIFGLEVMV